MDEVNIRDITSVETASGHLVKARYLSCAGFDLDNVLCFELHRLFLFNSKDRIGRSAYILNQAIETFFIFINKYNKNQSEKLKIDSLKKVNSEVFKAYIRDCQKNKITLEIPSKRLCCTKA